MSNSDSSTPAAPKGAGRFLRFSLIYAFGDLLTKGARIVLIPYYLSVMTKAEIGELAVLQAIIFCVWTILAFGLGFAVRRYYYDYENQSPTLGDTFVSTLWLGRLIVGLPIYAMLLGAGYLFCEFSGGSLALNLILVAISAGFLKGGLNVVEFWLNIREEPIKYRAFTFSQFLTTTLIIIYFVSVMKLGVMGVILGELVSYSFFALVSAFLLFRKARPKFAVIDWRELFSYCAPVLPHALFMWGMMGIDRLILNEYVDKPEIGVYEIGYLLGSFLSIVVRSMRAAWIPSYFKNANDEDSKLQFGKIASIYFYFAFYTALAGMLFAPEIIWLFSLTATSSYLESVHVMRIVLFGFVAMAVFLAINQPLLYERRTGILALISFSGLVINVLVNLWLIPTMGIWGAAAATVAAYVFMAFITFVVTRKIYQFEWETGSNLVVCSAFIAFAVAACYLPPEPVLWILPVKVGVLVAFPLVPLFRVHRSESKAIKIEPRFGWTQIASLRRKRQAPNGSQ